MGMWYLRDTYSVSRVGGKGSTSVYGRVDYVQYERRNELWTGVDGETEHSEMVWLLGEDE